MMTKACLVPLLFVMSLGSAAAADFSFFHPEDTPLKFIHTGFENASPLWYETDSEGNVQVYLVYDQERDSPNRANGHWFFQLVAEPGAQVTVYLNNLVNIWNGRKGIPVGEKTFCLVSPNGQDWRPIETEFIDEERLKFQVHFEQESLYVVHVEPYRISDLDRMLEAIMDHPLVDIIPIGRTVEGRELEIIRIGNPEAPNRVLLRARAHPWEAGGNWVVQGLIQSLLEESEENRQYLERYAVYILPMANKDGVARGRTRFNSLGMDLNRNWDQPADPELAPENQALELWIENMRAADQPIHLAIDLHNDQNGQIHLSRPQNQAETYLAQMEKYEALMRRYTWFTEGSTGKDFSNPGTFGEGLLARYGIIAGVQELNCEWIEGLKTQPRRGHWEVLGSQLRRVFYEYFAPAQD
jgi:hypothetical protein